MTGTETRGKVCMAAPRWEAASFAPSTRGERAGGALSVALTPPMTRSFYAATAIVSMGDLGFAAVCATSGFTTRRARFDEDRDLW